MLSPSDVDIALSAKESYSRCSLRSRGADWGGLSVSLGGTVGGVVRPFLSEDGARTDDLLWSPELLLVEVDFRGWAMLGDACELLLLPDGCD